MPDSPSQSPAGLPPAISAFIRILGNAIGPIGLGITLTGWLNPLIGVAAMVFGATYLIWELLALEVVVRNIPGMFRFLTALIIGCVLVGTSWEPIRSALARKSLEKPPTAREIAEEVVKTLPRTVLMENGHSRPNALARNAEGTRLPNDRSSKLHARESQSSITSHDSTLVSHSTEHCYLELFGMVMDGTVPGMVVNDTAEPMDDVRMDVMELLDKPLADGEPNPNAKLVGWQKRLEIGTCRARLADGLNERFPIGDHDHLSYSVWISSRYWTFRETIELRRTSQREYSEEVTVYRAADQKPMLETSTTLPIMRP